LVKIRNIGKKVEEHRATILHGKIAISFITVENYLLHYSSREGGTGEGERERGRLVWRE
jgi:hypothetical protein